MESRNLTFFDEFFILVLGWWLRRFYLWQTLSPLTSGPLPIILDPWPIVTQLWPLTFDLWHLIYDLKTLTSDSWSIIFEHLHTTLQIWYLTFEFLPPTPDLANETLFLRTLIDIFLHWFFQMLLIWWFWIFKF